MTGGLAGCFSEPVEHVAVWSEFLSLSEVRDHLPVLAQFDADLYLAVQPDDLSGELVAFLGDARAAGVEVRPWLQLPGAGIWMNEDNAQAFADFTQTFLDWAGANGVPVEWLIFDLEPSFEYAQQIQASADSGGVLAAIELLASHQDFEQFEAARQIIRDLVEQLHDSGIQVMAVTLPWTIDDLVDGDADIQDMFDTPLADVEWDQISVILYRPTLSDLLGVRLRPGYVSSYARSMASRYGDRAQVAIGNIATPGLLVPPGYTESFSVYRDVTAARSAGVGDVSLYSLDGMVLEGGPDVWLSAATRTTLSRPYLDPITALVRLAFVLLDRV
jgi:hypothetical protein